MLTTKISPNKEENNRTMEITETKSIAMKNVTNKRHCRRVTRLQAQGSRLWETRLGKDKDFRGARVMNKTSYNTLAQDEEDADYLTHEDPRGAGGHT